MFIDPGIQVQCGSTSQNYSTVIGTIVGGLIGFAASSWTTWLSNRLSTKAETKKAREDRIRELYDAVGLYEETFSSALRELNRRVPIARLSRDEADLILGPNNTIGRRIALLAGPEFPAVRRALVKAETHGNAFKKTFFDLWGKPVAFPQMLILFQNASGYSESLKKVQSAVYEALHGPGSSVLPKDAQKQKP